MIQQENNMALTSEETEDSQEAQSKETDNAVKISTEEEKANQRRAARRRKILENSKLRLDRLSGRINSSDYELMKTQGSASSSCAHEAQEYSDPEVEPDRIEFSPFTAAAFGSLGNSIEAENIFSNMANSRAGQETEASGVKKSKYYFIIQYRLHVLASTLLSYILVIMGTMSANVCSIFVPAGVCVVGELLIFRGQKQIAPLMSLIVALCGLNTERVNAIFQVVSIIQDLVTDLCLSTFLIASLSLILKFSGSQYDNLLMLK